MGMITTTLNARMNVLSASETDLLREIVVHLQEERGS
jgi:hypothetical protein